MIRLLLAMTAAVFIAACSTPYGTAVRTFREAPACCASLTEIPVETLDIGSKKSFDLGEGSPLYRFPTGKSYFRAFVLPRGPYPYRITVESFLIGDYLTSSYLFYPQFVTLDEERRVVRTTTPGDFVLAQTGFLEKLQEGVSLHLKVEGGLTFNEGNRDERYLVLLTTDKLRAGKTSVPLEKVPTYIPGYWDSGKKEHMQVVNGPVGRVRITVASLVPPPPGGGGENAAVPAEKPVTHEAAAPTAKGDGGVLSRGQVKQEIPSGEIPRAVSGGKPGGGGTSAAPAGLPVGAEKKGEPTPAAGEDAARVAIRLANGTGIGSLLLGRTRVEEGRSLLAAAGVPVGPDRTNAASFAVGTITLRPKMFLAPSGTPHQLYFDDNRVLVIAVDGSPTELPRNGGDFLARFPASRETGRSPGAYELQAPLSPCVTLIATFRAVGDTLDTAAFAYVCPTK